MSLKTAAILVGGLGTRLRPLISHVPKPLAPIGEEPFLFLLIRDLVKCGYLNIILLTSYRHEVIQKACGSELFGASILYSQEITPLGTAGALKHAESFLKNKKEFLLLNGDTYIDDFKLLVSENFDNALGLIGVMKPKKNDRYGDVLMDDKNKIISFQEKSLLKETYVNAGIYKFSSRVLDFIPEKKVCSLEKEIFPKLIEQHELLKGISLDGNFYDIGVPESYLEFVKMKREEG